MNQIVPYLNAHAGEALGIESFTGASVTQLYGGDYNHNFRVQAGVKELLVRINIEPQSGLDTQIEYEYDTLAFLSGHNIAPKPLFLDNSRSFFEYGLLVEEFVVGKHLIFDEHSVVRAAKAMATLHTIPLAGCPLRRRDNPLRDQVTGLGTYLEWITDRIGKVDELASLGKTALAKLETILPAAESSFSPISICHTDPNCANLIDNGESVYFIDWEQGRVDDPSYDVAAFLSPVLNRWASHRVMTDAEKSLFLDTYIQQTGFSDIRDKLYIRQLAYTLTAAIWARGRILDVDEAKISTHLGAQNYDRYVRMANMSGLRDILDAGQ